MNRRGFLRGLMALGAGVVVVGPSVLADVHRYLPVQQPIDMMAALTGLCHDIFVGRVVANVRRESPLARAFVELKPSDYTVDWRRRSLTFSAEIPAYSGVWNSSGQLVGRL